MKKIKLALGFAAGIAFGLIAWYFVIHPAFENENFKKNNVDQAEIALQKDALDVWIDDLVGYECKDCPDLYRKIDSNGRYSYGCLQFQELTFVSEVRRYNLLPSAQGSEYLNFIYDCGFQKQVARAMVLNNKDAWTHWYTSIAVRGLRMPPAQVAIK